MKNKLWLGFLIIFLISPFVFAASETTVGGRTGAGHIVQDEGTTRQQRPYLNFIGSAVSCVDSGGKTVCTITGASNGADINWVDADLLGTNQPNSLNWADLTPIFKAVETPAGESSTFSLVVGETSDINKLYIDENGMISKYQGVGGAGINWVDWDKIQSANINWSDVKGGELWEEGINWIDMESGLMPGEGINWSDIESAQARASAVNWLDLFNIAQTGVNWADLNMGMHTTRLIVDTPNETSDYNMGSFPADMTITKLFVLPNGGTNIIGNLYECDANGANCTGVVSSDVTAISSVTFSTTTFSNAGIAKDNVVQWLTTSISGTLTKVAIWFQWHFNSVNSY